MGGADSIAAVTAAVSDRLYEEDVLAGMAAVNTVLAGTWAITGEPLGTILNGALAAGSLTAACTGRYPDRFLDPMRYGIRGQVNRARQEMVPQLLDQRYAEAALEDVVDQEHVSRYLSEDRLQHARRAALGADPLDLLAEDDMLAVAEKPVEHVVDDLMREAVQRQVPGKGVGADYLYTGQQLHPDRIYQNLLRDEARFVRNTADPELGQETMALLEQPLSPDELSRIEEELRASADAHPMRLDADARDAYIAIRDFNHRVLDRYQPSRAVDALDREWGTSHMPYDTYLITDGAELQQAARDVGTCRRKASRSYFEAVAGDDHTIVFGVRRHDEQRWIGFGRAYLVEELDDELTWLAFDTLELIYRPGQQGGSPGGACNFADYGDVLLVEALAGIRYAMEQGLGGVLVGSAEGRVSGGPDDQYVSACSIGPGDLYTGNTCYTTKRLRKQGSTPTSAYAFSSQLGQEWEGDVDILFETMHTAAPQPRPEPVPVNSNT